MARLLPTPLYLLLFTAFLALPQESIAQWQSSAPFPGGQTDGAVSFVIDGVAYVGGGISNSNLYAFDRETGWSLVGAMPGEKMRAWSWVLVRDGKAIVGGGDTTGSFAVTSEVFEFDPATQVWRELNPFGGGARDGCWSFVIGEKGYVGSGFNGSVVVPDFWEYDFASDSWRQLPTPSLPPYIFASSFALNDRGYVIGGWSSTESNALFEYDPSSGNWVQRANFPGRARQAGTAFTYDGHGYYGAGMQGYTETFGDFYRYDPSSDSWSEVSGLYPESGAAWPISFVLEEQVWVGTGAGFSGGNLFFSDTFHSLNLTGGNSSVEESGWFRPGPLNLY